MDIDIRLLASFKGHRKRKRLKRLIGPEATDYLIDLWLTTRMDRPDGILYGWDEYDIADAAGWPDEKEPSEFINALKDALNITDLGEPDFKKLNIQWFNFGKITTY